MSQIPSSPTGMHIACSADENFVPDCAVMLHSLFESNPGESVTVHFLHDDRLPQSCLDGLAEVVNGGGGIWAPENVERDVRAIFPDTRRFGFNAWYRILLPRLLSELKQVLYLDCDLLIRGRIRELWETDITDLCLAAVTNPLFDYMLPRVRETLGVMDRQQYFNSGVMLLNLQRLRDGDYVDRLIDLIQSRSIPMPWADQDPLNAILHKECQLLHPRWNTMCAIYDLPWRYLPWSQEEMIEARDHPIIIHYIGAYKPWHYRLRHPYKTHYFEHLEQTPFRDRARNEGRSLRHVMLKYLPALWALHIDSFIINQLGRLLAPMRRRMRAHS